VKLQRIAVGDLVLARIKGRSVYGEVLEITDGQVNFRPLCPAAGWRHATAREIMGHWRKTGRRAAGAELAEEESRPPREQLSLPGCTRESRDVDTRHVAGASVGVPRRPRARSCYRGARPPAGRELRALRGAAD